MPAKQKRTKQRGGEYSSSCAASSDLNKYMASRCSGSNLHNTNPEAGNLNMAQGAGFLPGLRGGRRTATKKAQRGGASVANREQQQTGGSVCGAAVAAANREQQQTGGSAAPMTFEQYKDEIRNYLGGSLSQFGGKAKGKKSRARKVVKKTIKQKAGSYYSINPEEMIGGLPRVDKGDSCCQGVILGGKFLQGNKAGPVCGQQMGGRRKKTRKASKKQRKQKGGSRPASFPDAFNTEPGNFSPDAEGLDFSCSQPWWGPKCR
jgi:hypothetical protein